jgi:hypothetical protein
MWSLTGHLAAHAMKGSAFIPKRFGDPGEKPESPLFNNDYGALRAM